MKAYELNRILSSVFRQGSIHTFFDTLNKGVILIDTNEIISFVNKQASKDLYREASRIQGKSISDVFNFKYLKDVLTDGLCFNSVHVVCQSTKLIVSISPIEINLGIVGAIMVFEETENEEAFITTLKLCNSISRELESVINSSYDEIVIADQNGNILKISDAYQRLYNEELQDFVGKNVADLQKAGVFNPSVTLQVIHEKKRLSITQKTNSGRTLIVRGQPVFDENRNFVSVISMAKDITEVESLKEQLSEARKTVEEYYYELDILRQQTDPASGIVYKSAIMKKVMSTAERVARVDSNILITGESGVGKSMLAKEIHDKSHRSKNGFVSINCGAIPDTLLESELFGYEPGAFTGARKEGKIGKLAVADGGTLFLDEISELPLQMQVKLLKAIQEKSFTRVGGTKPEYSDFRLITATNRTLKELVQSGRFREDLYYRLNVIPIEIPPLRDRKEDIILLVNVFWDKLNRKHGTDRKIGSDAYDVLAEYQWPGNVRELQNCMERIMVTVDSDVIQICDLPSILIDTTLQSVKQKGIIPLRDALEETERSLIKQAFMQYKNTYKVAEVLGISQPTAVRKLHKYGFTNKMHEI